MKEQYPEMLYDMAEVVLYKQMWHAVEVAIRERLLTGKNKDSANLESCLRRAMGDL